MHRATRKVLDCVGPGPNSDWYLGWYDGEKDDRDQHVIQVLEPDTLDWEYYMYYKD